MPTSLPMEPTGRSGQAFVVRSLPEGQALGARQRVSTGATPTTWRFTGRRRKMLQSGCTITAHDGYDPVFGPVPVQPDTIVPSPGDPQSLNRYSYVSQQSAEVFRSVGPRPARHGRRRGDWHCDRSWLCVALPRPAQALNVAMADEQAFVQSVGLQLGNLFPAVTDQFVNPGQASGTASSSGGNMAGLDRPPGDPFRGLSDAAQRAISRLQRWSNHPIQQFAQRSSSATQSCRILGAAGSTDRCRRDRKGWHSLRPDARRRRCDCRGQVLDGEVCHDPVQS